MNESLAFSRTKARTCVLLRGGDAFFVAYLQAQQRGKSFSVSGLARRLLARMIKYPWRRQRIRAIAEAEVEKWRALADAALLQHILARGIVDAMESTTGKTLYLKVTRNPRGLLKSVWLFLEEGCFDSGTQVDRNHPVRIPAKAVATPGIPAASGSSARRPVRQIASKEAGTSEVSS